MPLTLAARLRVGTPTLAVLFVAASAVGQGLPAKKVLKHSDYEIWTTSGGFKLSPDGKFFAYTLTPPEGDAFVVLRNIPTGAEVRLPTTGKAATSEKSDAAAVATPPEPGAEPTPGGPPPAGPRAAAAPAARGGPILFSPDSKFVFFTQGPTRSATTASKAANDKPADLPVPALVIYDLAAGKPVGRVEKLRSYALVGDGAGFLLLHKEAPPADDTALLAVAGPALPAARRDGGSELVARNLADGKEVTFPEVASYAATKDGKQLLLTVASKTPAKSGLYAATLGQGSALAPIKPGPGRTAGLTWDEKQTKLAFFASDTPAPPTPPATPPAPGTPPPPPAPPTPTKSRVYLWQRDKAEPAVEIVPNAPAGLKAGYTITERGALNFSADGLKLAVSVGPTPPEPKAEAALAPRTAPPAARTPQTLPAGRTPGGRGGAGSRGAAGGQATPAADDKVELDLWHWKDETIQPMQKIRSGQDRAKTYRAVYFLDSKEFKQLGTEDTDVAVPNHGDWAVATSDKAYRAQLWRSPMPKDVALLNVRTGEGKPLIAAHEGSVASPYGNFVLAFDGRDWLSYAVPAGTPINLTAKLSVKFFNEDFDSPTTANAYGNEGFTSDRKHVLVRDRYDLWKLALDGTSAVNLTQTGRATNTSFRLVRLDEEDDLTKLDLGKPWLLSAVGEETRDGGFYRLEPGGKPKLLHAAPRSFGTVTKAKNADTLVMTSTTFADAPDYYATTLDFKEFKKVTDLQPKKREFNWGTAELVSYKSSDGVPLRGMLVKPEDFDPAKKYPMIVYIYERLSDGLHTLPPAECRHQHQPDLLRQQRLPRLPCRTSVYTTGCPRSVCVEVCTAGDPGGRGQGLPEREPPSASRGTVGAATRSPTSSRRRTASRRRPRGHPCRTW